MMLYHINPNDYGEEYYVMAESKQDALESLKKHLYAQGNNPDNEFASYDAHRYENWKSATLDDMPERFSIDEYGPGQVVESEVG